ncbi:MAG: nuclear transport factor 2 family protein [Firmicutes bacterium]|nr:nuclear transport factor 2 family protein [Bacillota bacterium]
MLRGLQTTVLPIYIEGIRFDREQFVTLFQLNFLFIEVHEFQVAQRNISINGDSAVVEGVLRSKVITWGEPFEDEEQIVLQLKKVGGAWKLLTLPVVSD